MKSLTSSLYRLWMSLRGYREHVPYIHPLQSRARSVSDSKRNYLQLQIAKHRDLEHNRRLEAQPERCYSHPGIAALGSMDGFIAHTELVVDQRGYDIGLW